MIFPRRERFVEYVAASTRMQSATSARTSGGYFPESCPFRAMPVSRHARFAPCPFRAMPVSRVGRRSPAGARPGSRGARPRGGYSPLN